MGLHSSPLPPPSHQERHQGHLPAGVSVLWRVPQLISHVFGLSQHWGWCRRSTECWRGVLGLVAAVLCSPCIVSPRPTSFVVYLCLTNFLSHHSSSALAPILFSIISLSCLSYSHVQSFLTHFLWHAQTIRCRFYKCICDFISTPQPTQLVAQAH